MRRLICAFVCTLHKLVFSWHGSTDDDVIVVLCLSLISGCGTVFNEGLFKFWKKFTELYEARSCDSKSSTLMHCLENASVNFRWRIYWKVVLDQWTCWPTTTMICYMHFISSETTTEKVGLFLMHSILYLNIRQKRSIRVFQVSALKKLGYGRSAYFTIHSKMFRVGGKNLGRVGKPETHIYFFLPYAMGTKYW